MERFRGCVVLKHKVAIYIPSEGGAYIENVKREWSEAFGGCTVMQVKGCYKEVTGKVISEDITVIYSFCNDVNEALTVAHIDAVWIKEQMKQESVAIEFDGVMVLV